MKTQKYLLSAVVGLAVLALVAAPAMAGCPKSAGVADGKTCPMKKDGDRGAGAKQCQMADGRGMGGSDCSGSSSGCPIASKLCMKACWLMQNKDALGLTDDQMSKIKELKLGVDKSAIRGEAEMKVFALELENQLHHDTVNVEAIESMIDSGMAGMATAAKATVKAYAELKTVLTDEQKAKAKELKKAGR